VGRYLGGAASQRIFSMIQIDDRGMKSTTCCAVVIRSSLSGNVTVFVALIPFWELWPRLVRDFLFRLLPVR
jgi:hypothetical protein